jgi:PST family polysaccharide transporter
VQAILRVVLVVVGLGPLGYVIAEPVSEAGRTIAYWWLSRPRIRMAAQWRRWKFLLADSGWMFLATNANKLVEQADKLILGLYHVKDTVGAYFWAYMVSRQAIDVFVWNLEKILLPALSHLQLDPQRQIQAFLRAARMLAVAIVPACLMLAATVDPLLHFIYPAGDRHDSIPVIQIVSAAMSMWVIYGPTASLIKAQGRFRLFMILTWIYAAFFLSVVFFAAWYSDRLEWNGAISMAIAVAVCMTVFGPIQAYIGIRPGGGTWMDVARIYLPPIALSIVAVGGGLLLATAIPAVAASHVLKIAVIVLVGGGLYLALLRTLMPGTFRELFDQLAHFRTKPTGG